MKHHLHIHKPAGFHTPRHLPYSVQKTIFIALTIGMALFFIFVIYLLVTSLGART
ncbi:MAG TPA: hypothetical protein VEV16_13175 [Daejeonella sp.]|nr:hypothetical protein [Daejeonella sp.]